MVEKMKAVWAEKLLPHVLKWTVAVIGALVVFIGTLLTFIESGQLATMKALKEWLEKDAVQLRAEISSIDTRLGRLEDESEDRFQERFDQITEWARQNGLKPIEFKNTKQEHYPVTE